MCEWEGDECGRGDHAENKDHGQQSCDQQCIRVCKTNSGVLLLKSAQGGICDACCMFNLLLPYIVANLNMWDSNFIVKPQTDLAMCLGTSFFSVSAYLQSPKLGRVIKMMFILNCVVLPFFVVSLSHCELYVTSLDHGFLLSRFR